MSAIRSVSSAGLFPLLAGSVSAAACYHAAGASLGLFIGALFVLTVLVPPVTVAAERWPGWLTAAVTSVLPLVIGWGVASRRSETTAGEWAASSAVLLAYAVALAGVSVALAVTPLRRVGAAAAVALTGLTWLTWPIWLSQAWEGEGSAATIARLAAVHPGLAVSLPHLGQWVEQSVAYQLTGLNQDVPFAPPATVTACVVSHGLIGVGLVLLRTWVTRRQTASVTASVGPAQPAPPQAS
jgi:hypothetical protein